MKDVKSAADPLHLIRAQVVDLTWDGGTYSFLQYWFYLPESKVFIVIKMQAYKALEAISTLWKCTNETIVQQNTQKHSLYGIKYLFNPKSDPGKFLMGSKSYKAFCCVTIINSPATKWHQRRLYYSRVGYG